MIIHENVLNQEGVEAIRTLLSSGKIPWYFLKDCAYGSVAGDDNLQMPPGMEHLAQSMNPSFTYTPFKGGNITGQLPEMNAQSRLILKMVYPVINGVCKEFGLNSNKLFRVRLGLELPLANPPLHHNPHTDMRTPHTTVLYYVNNSDGDTFFFDDDLNITDRVTPKAGKAIMFDGLTYHASSNPSKSYRLVINMNFEQ